MDLSLEDIFIKLVDEKKKGRLPQNKQPKKASAEVGVSTGGDPEAEDYFNAPRLPTVLI